MFMKKLTKFGSILLAAIVALFFFAPNTTEVFASDATNTDEAAQETFWTPLDWFCFNEIYNPGFSGGYIELDNDSLLTAQKYTGASKSKLKKNAISVSEEELVKDPLSYDGKLIKLENAVLMEGGQYFNSADNWVLFEQLLFMTDNCNYVLFCEPNLFTYTKGKVVDLYFVSFGKTEILSNTAEPVTAITGWMVRKPTNSTKVEATCNIYQYSTLKYIDVSGKFAGTVENGKPNGFGAFNYHINDVEISIIGNFYADKPLDGTYNTVVIDGDEYAEFVYENGVFVKGYSQKYTEAKSPDEEGVLTTFEMLRAAKEGTLAIVTFENNVYLDSFHVEEKTGKMYEEASDILIRAAYENMQDCIDESVTNDSLYDAYCTIENVKSLSKKKIRKQASEVSAQELISNVGTHCEDIIKLENLEAAYVETVEIGDAKGTQILTMVDGTEFSFIVGKKVSLEPGDVFDAYFTPATKINLKDADGKDLPAVITYAYIAEKAE